MGFFGNMSAKAGCIKADGETHLSVRKIDLLHRVCGETEEQNMRNRMLMGAVVVGGLLAVGASTAGAQQVEPYGTTPPTVASTTTVSVASAPSTTVKLVGGISPAVAGVEVAADPGLAASRLPVTGADLSALGALGLAGLGLVGVRASRRRTIEN